ncbi:hypothetical protein CJF31_00011654 [Rutstroemia sp. NJR-2017a BVV2]|nr:hypothetical protein CJF31_00011654 [Rutstroemia sp. NJR-2017a BVV2]
MCEVSGHDEEVLRNSELSKFHPRLDDLKSFYHEYEYIGTLNNCDRLYLSDTIFRKRYQSRKLEAEYRDCTTPRNRSSFRISFRDQEDASADGTDLQGCYETLVKQLVAECAGNWTVEDILRNTSGVVMGMVAFAAVHAAACGGLNRASFMSEYNLLQKFMAVDQHACEAVEEDQRVLGQSSRAGVELNQSFDAWVALYSKMALNLLPNELVYNILSYLDYDRKDLLNYSLVCHNLWDVATAILYSDIKFKLDFNRHDDEWDINEEKVTILLNALASNPNLGAKVRTLNLRFKFEDVLLGNEYLNLGEEQGGQVARNMPYLTKASLSECGLTRHIIANISSFSQLMELELRTTPESSQWDDKQTSLKKLSWKVPYYYSHDGSTTTTNCWNTAVHAIKIVGTVFPQVTELDITNVGRSIYPREVAPPPLSEVGNEDMQNILLPQLCSFRYQGAVPGKDSESVLHFIRRHHSLLTSLAMSFGWRPLDQEMMRYMQQVIAAAPKLKSLTALQSYEENRWQSHKLPVWSDSTPSPASTKEGIEFFEMWNIGCPLSAEIGKLFSGWNSLRVLKIGAPQPGEDGRPLFNEAVPKILDFVRNLPHSIEEMYMELENDNVVCYEDEEFDPIEAVAPKIFKAMPRLHKLDINAWITDIDRSTGYLPEKAVICRRRPSEDAENKQKKVIWISRFDCAYQEPYAGVGNMPVEMEGNFEGKDADEPWLGGNRSVIYGSSRYWANGEYLKKEDDDSDSYWETEDEDDE